MISYFEQLLCIGHNKDTKVNRPFCVYDLVLKFKALKLSTFFIFVFQHRVGYKWGVCDYAAVRNIHPPHPKGNTVIFKVGMLANEVYQIYHFVVK